MAISSNLTFGHGLDDKLRVIHEEMPDAFQGDFIAEVAALLRLDELFGLRRDDDIIFVAPGYMVWLIMMVTPADLVLEGEILAREEPFEVDFVSPEGEEVTETYPEIVRNKRLRVRVMDNDQSEALGAVCTVRADGSVIYPPSDRADNIDDL